MGTLTTNYQFQKPTVGADDDVWGTDYSIGDPSVDPSPGLNGNWEKTDVLLKAMQDEIDQLKLDVEARKIPVGGLYVSRTDDDPATNLGYGTWSAWAPGRALVSVGDNTEHNWAIDEQRGADAHTLDETEVPAHRHGPGTLKTDTDTHDHGLPGNVVDDQNSGWGSPGGPIGFSGTRTNNDSHSHSVTSGETDETGGGLPHNNVQPSQAAYIWERTA